MPRMTSALRPRRLLGRALVGVAVIPASTAASWATAPATPVAIALETTTSTVMPAPATETPLTIASTAVSLNRLEAIVGISRSGSL